MYNSVDEIREFSLGEMLSIAVNIIKTHWKTFFTAGLIFYGAFVLLGLLIYHTIDFSSLQSVFDEKFAMTLELLKGSNNASSNLLLSMLAGMKGMSVGLMISRAVINLGIGLFGFYLTFVIALMVEQCSRNETPDLKQAFTRASTKFFVGFVTFLLYMLVIVGLSITIILGIVALAIAIYWKFFAYAIILRDKSFVQAFTYSIQVVRYRWWIILLYTIILALMQSFISSILNLPFVALPDTIEMYGLAMLVVSFVATFFLVVEAVFFINFDATTRQKMMA